MKFLFVFVQNAEMMSICGQIYQNYRKTDP
jgi:hypothetical protein